jgi:hypothetical protein
MARAYVSLIQSDYGRSRHGNFEATIVYGPIRFLNILGRQYTDTTSVGRGKS